MIDFIELNETQKNYVMYLRTFFKHDADTISLAQMKTYHDTMVYHRTTGGPKFGYPNWLIKPNNKTSKSVYHFPQPTEDDIEAFIRGDVDAKINLDKFSPMFKSVVTKYNLLENTLH